jgi:hypothetical protein
LNAFVQVPFHTIIADVSVVLAGARPAMYASPRILLSESGHRLAKANTAVHVSH